ncbi:MAG: cyclic 2,3-diphosphoglycerate synthase [Pseudomonadales bacterium]|jgi:predicted GTPase|nr:cyclic 2,3-diphosphoglycerate synthase [Pseudomonadales bacterium]MDP7360412.1 cyclic 2,3-diphosphoglycerate synthase [Pseudomonadales bacterium]MDP7595226.1 cyclic 2,3-diphosphoglycerate synthase [Pseudomonadales bacterium]HJN53116.1 cyclic 2,3-diphosphoglycerate synthase [Pseudomonadales bacterium]|tara:strand:- start:10 stop:1323 length:1314 start_codon:yes stop_codon:yes gene_type:complete
MKRKRIIIMGAAGRDFHNFNLLFRQDATSEVVAFTATQIPDIEDRVYPRQLTGQLYPEGIPIFHEADLVNLVKEHKVDEVVFSYSDVSYETVMHKAAIVNAAGASFVLPGVNRTMLSSTKPVVALCSVRTGCGKSQAAMRVAAILKSMGKKLVVVRHPMPYGDLLAQKCQRFETYQDLSRHGCTIEEREESEPHLAMNSVVYAGVDYQEILSAAEQEADVIIWDGGNNDTPFFEPDLHIVVVDPLRPGHELSYCPGETNLRMADVILINKEFSANIEDIETVKENIRSANPDAVTIDASSPLHVEDPSVITGKRVLAVEDGPTLTHGEMQYGVAVLAAERHGAAQLVDPRPYLVGTLKETFERYKGIGILLPAVGYSDQQIADLERTINDTECDAVIIGTPIDLRKLITINKPVVRVTYEIQEIGKPDLRDVLQRFQ